jgi:hypothetical protein
MSTLSQFTGGGIKSIQRGVISFASGGGGFYNTTQTATITAVDMAKTMLNFCGSRSGVNNSGGSSAYSVAGSIALTSSTVVTASSPSVFTSFGAPPSVSYEVIEFY